MLSKKRINELVPLLNALKCVNSKDRIILLAHLDDKTRDDLYLTITSVLRSNKLPIETKLALKKKLHPHKDSLRCLITKGESKDIKKKKLAQIGGSPMKILLNTAVPLMLGLFPK